MEAETTQTDPLIESLMEGIPDEVDENPYVGKHDKARLADAEPCEPNQYGYSVKLKWNLSGDADKPRPFTKIVNLPGDDNGEEKTNFINRMSRDKLASIMHAGGLYPAKRKVSKVCDDETYGKIVAIFKAGVGRALPIRVTERDGNLDVWGLKVRTAK